MAKKKLKLKKTFRIVIVVVILLAIAAWFGIKKYQEYKYHQTYEYKLLTVGYSYDETVKLQELFDNEKLDELVSKEKDDVLLKLIDQKYFILKNLDRYYDYLQKNSKATVEDTVILVNVNRDYDYYEHDIDTDTTKDTLLIVNKYYTLSKDYKIDDFVTISNNYSWGTNQKTRQVVYDAYLEMWEAAKENGIYLMVNSSFRSYEEQDALYKKYTKEYNQRYADGIAARPGHTEHSTGLCLDIFSKANPSRAKFTESTDFEWLKNNAHKYGFILRYPEGKENITGYNAESWHYRYVGVEVATFIYENDLTFDEYYAYYLDK